MKKYRKYLISGVEINNRDQLPLRERRRRCEECASAFSTAFSSAVSSAVRVDLPAPLVAVAVADASPNDSAVLDTVRDDVDFRSTPFDVGLDVDTLSAAALAVVDDAGVALVADDDVVLALCSSNCLTRLSSSRALLASTATDIGRRFDDDLRATAAAGGDATALDGDLDDASAAIGDESVLRRRDERGLVVAFAAPPPRGLVVGDIDERTVDFELMSMALRAIGVDGFESADVERGEVAVVEGDVGAGVEPRAAVDVDGRALDL
jgi:hypothetical protein